MCWREPTGRSGEKASRMKAVLLLIGFMLAHIHFAEAQQPTKVFRIGYLSSFDVATESALSEAIRQALRERGHIEGQNIAIEYRYAEGKRERLPELAAE